MAIDLTARLSLKDNYSKKLERASKKTRRFDDATSRLNGGFNRLNNNFRKVNRSTGAFRSSVGSTIGTITTMVGVIGGAALAAKGLQATLGGAMEIETNKLTLETLIGDAETANQLFADIQAKASKSTFDERAFQTAAKAYAPITKSVDGMNALLGLSERLASSNPMEGMEGAAFSIRELLSGDYQSIVERFNIPRSQIKTALDGADSVSEKMKALDGVLKDMGYTQSFVNKTNRSASAQWGQLRSNASMAMAQMGTAALEKLKKPLQDVNAWVSGGGMDWLKEKGSDFLVGAVEKAISFGQTVRNNWPQIKETVLGIKESLEPVGEAIQTMYDNAKQAGSYIISNWGTIKPIVVSLAAGMLTLKASFAAMRIVGTITGLLKAYRASTFASTLATRGFSAALRSNPIGAVITAITLLVMAGVYLWQNWDVVKAKAKQLWAVMSAVWTMIWNKVKTVAVNLATTVASKFQQIKSGISNAIQSARDIVSGAFDSMRTKATNAINGIIGLVNKMISKINGFSIDTPDWLGGKSFSLNVPKIPKVGNQSYHGDPYVAKSGFRYVHQGERILTAQENSESKRGGSGEGGVSVTGNTFIVRQESDIDNIAEQLYRKINSAYQAGAHYG